MLELFKKKTKYILFFLLQDIFVLLKFETG